MQHAIICVAWHDTMRILLICGVALVEQQWSICSAADDQRRQLQRHLAALHHAPIDTLEFIGGGGVRCSLGEVF
jgi:hypothetical protein